MGRPPAAIDSRPARGQIDQPAATAWGRRGLDNLIWVYSAGVGNKTVDYRKQFYPGTAYVDISGIDIYNVDFATDAGVDKYWSYWNDMQAVSPDKMLALGGCEAMLNPDLMADGTMPSWLSAMP